jgi:hypothetical protein
MMSVIKFFYNVGSYYPTLCECVRILVGHDTVAMAATITTDVIGVPPMYNRRLYDGTQFGGIWNGPPDGGFGGVSPDCSQ